MNEIDRVRCSTCATSNAEIENKIRSTLVEYSGKSQEEITKRIVEVEKEWSIERWIEVNSSVLALIGVILGLYVSVYWFILPIVILTFVLLHAVRGWCPPIPLLRKFNVRTRREMDWEKYALKFLRGDFDNINKSNTEDVYLRVKKVHNHR